MTSGTKPVALVTGGRRGIGLGIAEAMALTGFDLTITGIQEAEGAEPVLRGLQELGANAIYVRADISDLAEHREAIDATLARFGRIDCLVNNAGMGSVVRGDFLDLAPENYDRIMATNLRGTIFFTQAVAKAMLADGLGQGRRSIINITSVSAALSSPERLDYCISKAGLASFSQGLALRLADEGISVFEVRPGIIRTEMTAGVSSKYDGLIASGLVPMKRWGEASDIGSICASLASGAFGFATGSMIDAGGGLAIGRL